MSDPTVQSTNFPLFPIEVQIQNHAILCSTGFLILVPLGVLVARYLRTFRNEWWWAHWVLQFIISGPMIFVGWAYGNMATSALATGHFNDTHKKIGLALLILYIAQMCVGTFIHFTKFSSFAGRRPPQNYFHAVLGLGIIALAGYQVYYGLATEWALGTGNLHLVPQSAMTAWIVIIVIFWALYGLGLAFLPRQYIQERQSKDIRRDLPINGWKA